MGTHFGSNANAWPWLSRTTTPRPALPIFLKVAPSKLTFREFGGGGDHLTRVGEWADIYEEAVRFALLKS